MLFGVRYWHLRGVWYLYLEGKLLKIWTKGSWKTLVPTYQAICHAIIKHVHIFIHTYMHIHVHTHTDISRYADTDIHTYQHTYICMYVWVCADKSLAWLTSRCHRMDSVVGKRCLFMCQIASLFLLQRLKGSMSGNVHDFKNVQTWAVIIFFLQGKLLKEIQAILTETLGEHAPSDATVKNCFSVVIFPPVRRHKTVTTPKIFIKFTS
jgi:hypothetical protein